MIEEIEPVLHLLDITDIAMDVFEEICEEEPSHMTQMTQTEPNIGHVKLQVKLHKVD